MSLLTLVLAWTCASWAEPPAASSGTAAVAAAVSSAAAPAPPQPSYAERHDALLKGLKAWFLDDEGKIAEPTIAFSSAEESAHTAEIAALGSLAAQIRFLRRGRVAALDDWQTYSDMAAALARLFEIKPAESVLPLYRGRVRAESDPLAPAEKLAREELLAQTRSPGPPKRYFFISELVGAPEPQVAPAQPKVVYVRTKRGKRIKKVIQPPELPPPPKPVSVISRIDWEKADELAEVADDNAHRWDRKPKESLKRYRRRLRQLRAHCYEWVRRDLQALGIWNTELFRGYVPPTRRDRKRPIRAASFALAMAKISASEKLAVKTTLRELDLRVDPLVRGSIVVFSQSVCDYSAKNGHIEIITSVDPLQAASFKFHPVKTECLIAAANQNKVHVYVPLRLTPSAAAEATAEAATR